MKLHTLRRWFDSYSNHEQADNSAVHKIDWLRTIPFIALHLSVLFVLVVGKTNHEIADFVSQKLSHIDGVQGTVTQFVLKRYKEDGEIIEEQEEVKRQPVIL